MCISMKVKLYVSTFTKDEGCSIFDILAILDLVYNACHDTNDKYHKSVIHVVSGHFHSVELSTFVNLFQTERHKVY